MEHEWRNSKIKLGIWHETVIRNRMIIILKNVVKRLENSATINTFVIIIIATSKTKTCKFSAFVVMMRTSSKQFLQNVTRPAKSVKKIWRWRHKDDDYWTQAQQKIEQRWRQCAQTAQCGRWRQNAESERHEKLTAAIATTDFKIKYPTKVWRDHGFYTDDYIKLINGHWFKFMSARSMSHYILGFLYVIIIVFGCFGNFLVIFSWKDMSRYSKRANTYFFIHIDYVKRDDNLNLSTVMLLVNC